MLDGSLIFMNFFCRLLMDLTNGQNIEQPNQQRPEQQSQTVFHQAPVHHPQNPSGSSEPVVGTLPDLLESTQSTEPRGLRQRQSSDKCEDKVQLDLIEHVHHRHETDNNDSVLDFYPDLVPGYENRLTREDLEIKLSHQRKRYSTSSDYFSLDGSQMEDILEDEQDLDDQDHDLKINGVNWTNLGHQLTEIASAFEVSYAPAMTPTQRIVYHEYRKLKAKSLALSREEKNLMGLAKTVCRQMLLSSIWILMKKFI